MTTNPKNLSTMINPNHMGVKQKWGRTNEFLFLPKSKLTVQWWFEKKNCIIALPVLWASPKTLDELSFRCLRSLIKISPYRVLFYNHKTENKSGLENIFLLVTQVENWPHIGRQGESHLFINRLSGKIGCQHNFWSTGMYVAHVSDT